ncbi:MAG: NUDIX hydrolase [Candidatus Helarchaeota archaeon]
MKVVKPIPATTIILIREIEGKNNDIEVLMTKRQPYLRFLGGFFVFPGGKIEEQDCSHASIKRLKGIKYENACKILNLNDNLTDDNINHNSLLGFWIAGIRELFEEIGILIAVDDNNRPIKSFNSELFTEYRYKIINNEITMTEMMEKENLFYAGDRLYYYNRFITPKMVPRRFDTRFFIYRISKNQENQIIPYEKEISEVVWIRPQDALDHHNKHNNFKIIFPQIVSLKDLLYLDLTCLY